MSANNQASYSASATIANGVAALPTSSAWVAGWSLAEIDNSSGKYLDRPLGGSVTVGASPTTGTAIEVWLVPKLSDSTYFDNFDGTSKAVTVSSRSALTGYATLVGYMSLDSGTSNRAYGFRSSAIPKNEIMPAKYYQLFVVHNTGVNLNATAGNHVFNEFPELFTTG